MSSMTGVPTTTRARGRLESRARWAQMSAMLAPAETPPSEMRVGSMLNLCGPCEWMCCSAANESWTPIGKGCSGTRR
jgi:hypothetical protein